MLTTYLEGSDSGNNEAGEGDDHLEAFLGLEGGEIFLHRSEVLPDEGGEGLSNFGGYLVRAPKRAAMVLSFGLVHEVFFLAILMEGFGWVWMGSGWVVDG